nr:hypothetical protein [Borreliella turdi]
MSLYKWGVFKIFYDNILSTSYTCFLRFFDTKKSIQKSKSPKLINEAPKLIFGYNKSLISGYTRDNILNNFIT